jgi:mannose-6-phosphate isomerase
VLALRAPLFLNPMFQERIWGGNGLKRRFGYEIPSDRTGESWAISAHPDGMCTVREGHWKNRTLDEVWRMHPDWFGASNPDPFPLLVKILDAREDLSVQVHPDDDYAGRVERGKGKTECWYVLDCREGAELVYGHTARSRDEFVRRAERGEWDGLLRRIRIRPGDFIYVPSGTVHALCTGTMVVEIQQNSDTTYRIYDYSRTDESGRKRELHMEKALDVIRFPHREEPVRPRVIRQKGATVTRFVSNVFFTVERWEIRGRTVLMLSDVFRAVTVIHGGGKLRLGSGSFAFRKGDSFLLPAGSEKVSIFGDAEWILAEPGK